MLRTVFRLLLALLVIFAGTMHFLRSDIFVAIVPDYLPAHLALVYISGVCEILGGIGLLIPKVQRAAAWGLLALFIAVFPANVHMAIHQIPFNGVVYPVFGWVRLPLQAVLIYWAYVMTKVPAAPADSGARSA